MSSDEEKSLGQRAERPTLRDLFQDVREQIEQSGISEEELDAKIQEAVEEVRTRRALADAKNGEGRPAKEVLEEVRKILDGPRLMGWISVKERLPEKDSSVLVAGYGRYVTIADWYKGSGWSVGREELFGSKDVTHWMPLPEPPIEKPTALNQGQTSEDER